MTLNDKRDDKHTPRQKFPKFNSKYHLEYSIAY